MVGAASAVSRAASAVPAGSRTETKAPSKIQPHCTGGGGGFVGFRSVVSCFVHLSASMESDMRELNSGSIAWRPRHSLTAAALRMVFSFARRWRRAGVAEPVSTVHLVHLPLWRIPAGSARQLLSCWSPKNVIQARPFLALPRVQLGVWIASDPQGMWQRPRASPFSPDHFIIFVQGLFS